MTIESRCPTGAPDRAVHPDWKKCPRGGTLATLRAPHLAGLSPPFAFGTMGDAKGRTFSVGESMSESEQRLRATLNDLHEQLQSVEGADPETQARLREAMDDIRAALKASGVEALDEEKRSSLTERLQEGVRQLESSHPLVAGTVERLIYALSQIGI
jgi:hypothetical protein